MTDQQQQPQRGGHDPSGFLARLGAWRGSATPFRESVVVPRAVKRLILPVTRKGGVGKTFFAHSLADWYRELSVAWVAYETDWSSGSLTRFLPEIKFLDIANGDAVAEIEAGFQSADVMILDGLGPLQAYIFEWLQDSRFFRELSVPVELTLVVVIEEDKDTVAQAGEAARSLDVDARWLVVRNLKTCPTTEIYNESEARQELLKRGATEIQLDRVPWNLLLLMQSSSKTLCALRDDSEVPFLERQRIRSHVEKVHAQFQLAERILLPASALRAEPSAEHHHSATATPAPLRPRVAPERV